MRRPGWLRRQRPALVDRRRIVMLMWNAHGPGGVARTVLNLANHLARTRDVEIVSVTRKGRSPRFPVDPSIRICFLEDESEDAVAGMLSRRDPSVVISSRPVLHQSAVRGADGRHVLIGQDHGNFETRMASSWVRGVLAESLAGLDAFTVLTGADARDYREQWPDARAEIAVLHNALPFDVAPTVAPLSNPVVLAAGRLIPEKGFARLIDAFAPVAADHPEWQLHICGQGPARDDLLRLADERGVGAQVRLFGHVDDLQARMRDAAFLAMASETEGFAMVLTEAMSQGIPVLAYDCPRGPAELIVDGTNGFLVPDGDHDAYVGALRTLVEDEGRRRQLAAAALEHAQDYRIERIGRQWEELVDRLVEAHNARLLESG